MISDLTIRKNYSSEVRLWLMTDDSCMSLSRIGPGYVVLSDATDLAPCEAKVRMLIDDREHEWKVVVKHGAVPFDNKVAVDLVDG